MSHFSSPVAGERAEILVFLEERLWPGMLRVGCQPPCLWMLGCGVSPFRAGSGVTGSRRAPFCSGTLGRAGRQSGQKRH